MLKSNTPQAWVFKFKTSVLHLLKVYFFNTFSTCNAF